MIVKIETSKIEQLKHQLEATVKDHN